MILQTSELNNNIRLLKLIGRLDIAGTNEIETQFAAYCAEDNARVIVDLSEVDFLASSGIRLITLNAKVAASRGGKLVLLNPQAEVQQVLEVTGIPAVIPIHAELESAEQELMAV